MKKTLIVIAVIAVAAGSFLALRSRNSKAAAKYTEAAAATRDLSEYVEVTGYVAPLNRVEISPSASGRVEKILVEEGVKVKAGDTLALMSSSDRVAILDAARSMSDEQYKYWQDAYKAIKVVSPLDGTIILKDVVEGQTVTASSVLFAISDKLIIEATVDESDIGRVKVGQAATITLDAYPDKPVTGRVFQILDEGTTTNNVITYKVKVRADGVPSFFKSQMTANLKIRISAGRTVLQVPSTAVVIGPDGKTAVITALKDGKPVYTNVVTGAIDGDAVEITSGIEDGETVYCTNTAYKPQKAESTGTNPFMPKFNRRGSSSGGGKSSGRRSSSSGGDAGGPPPGM